MTEKKEDKKEEVKEEVKVVKPTKPKFQLTPQQIAAKQKAHDEKVAKFLGGR